jgi:hypothetical protein
MNPLLNIVVLIATGAVAVVLILGLRNMARGGNPNTSQLLMRWRIGLQFIAILVILAVLYVTGR